MYTYIISATVLHCLLHVLAECADSACSGRICRFCRIFDSFRGSQGSGLMPSPPLKSPKNEMPQKRPKVPKCWPGGSKILGAVKATSRFCCYLLCLVAIWPPRTDGKSMKKRILRRTLFWNTFLSENSEHTSKMM